MANFGNVNFLLLLNFLRNVNVILPHILPLLQTDVSGCSGLLKTKRDERIKLYSIDFYRIYIIS